MNFKNYYKVLGLKDHATAPEIKRAYRSLAFRYHPDHNKAGVSGQERFVEIKEAYDFLINPANKKMLDAELRARHIHAPSYEFWRYLEPQPEAGQTAAPPPEKLLKPWWQPFVKPLLLVVITVALMYLMMNPPRWLKNIYRGPEPQNTTVPG